MGTKECKSYVTDPDRYAEISSSGCRKVLPHKHRLNLEVSMKHNYQNRTLMGRAIRYLTVMVLSSALISPGTSLIFASTPERPFPEEQTSTIPPEQLEALVAPIALYPDNLLAQVLVAST